MTQFIRVGKRCQVFLGRRIPRKSLAKARFSNGVPPLGEDKNRDCPFPDFSLIYKKIKGNRDSDLSERARQNPCLDSGEAFNEVKGKNLMRFKDQLIIEQLISQ